MVVVVVDVEAVVIGMAVVVTTVVIGNGVVTVNVSADGPLEETGVKGTFRLGLASAGGP